LESELISKEQFLAEFTPLVKRIAHHMMVKLPASVRVGDLVQVGMIGLLDAISRYEGSYGRQFESYAALRIRGSILDHLREEDWMPRRTRDKKKQIDAAMQSLEHRLFRSPSEQELATELNITLDEYHEAMQEARGGQLIHYEDFQEEDEDHFLDRFSSEFDSGPLEILLDKKLRESLAIAIENLPPREKMVMGMRYEQEMNLREIGEVLGVSESRVCQIHTQVIARLRLQLKSL
jgi:RNA polymerase sigma factor for flagellar operon FliA